METEKKKNCPDQEDSFYACSARECTGLIPALPKDGAELEAYEDLYPFVQKAEKTEKE
ncbi:MAG TPA: hypothetical protein IAB71_05085 [Candidatus Scatomonas pullistercoris]|mgnify:CR=1 FL=1|uniref:Uncharacterized protein n=1 Tax=Candidatus Scatomonas pullistercoris TaxID=2840920 RepID=A0A9D1T9U5_9FIRM|nr:hypothetical protein [Candidatus Scatomonas pullistercoris]